MSDEHKLLSRFKKDRTKERIGMYISKLLMEEVRAVAVKYDETVSKVVEDFIEHGLEDLRIQEEEEGHKII